MIELRVAIILYVIRCFNKFFLRVVCVCVLLIQYMLLSFIQFTLKLNKRRISENDCVEIFIRRNEKWIKNLWYKMTTQFLNRLCVFKLKKGIIDFHVWIEFKNKSKENIRMWKFTALFTLDISYCHRMITSAILDRSLFNCLGALQDDQK